MRKTLSFAVLLLPLALGGCGLLASLFNPGNSLEPVKNPPTQAEGSHR